MNMTPKCFQEAVARESTYKNKRLNPNVGCLNCTIRPQCDNLCAQRGRQEPLYMKLLQGVNGAIPCIRLHVAFAPQHLVDNKGP